MGVCVTLGHARAFVCLGMRVLVRALCAFLGFFRVLSLSLACFMIVLACIQFGLKFTIHHPTTLL